MINTQDGPKPVHAGNGTADLPKERIMYYNGRVWFVLLRDWNGYRRSVSSTRMMDYAPFLLMERTDLYTH